METENKVFEPHIPQKPRSTKKIVISAIAILLAIALIVGLVIFLIPTPAVFSYEGISVDPAPISIFSAVQQIARKINESRADIVCLQEFNNLPRDRSDGLKKRMTALGWAEVHYDPNLDGDTPIFY